ncbi:hypothetical protein P4S72_26660 [Vibrio sp. PP-XX7]
MYKDTLAKETNQQVIRQIIDNLGQISTQYPEAIDVLKNYIPTIGITSLKNHAQDVLNQVQQ